MRQSHKVIALGAAGIHLTVMAVVVYLYDARSAQAFGGAFTFACVAYAVAGLIASIAAVRVWSRA